MLVSLSQYMNINPIRLKELGVFNTILDSDSLYFINFMCLKDTEAIELQDSYEHLNSVFKSIAVLLKASKRENDIFYRKAFDLLEMNEFEEICLGYSMFGTSGSGSGSKYKKLILNTAKEIILAGIEEPEIFQLVGLFEEGIGPDRISDMIGRIIKQDLVEYSKRIYADLLEETSINDNLDFEDGLLINEYNGKKLILLPYDILNELPLASSWEDIDFVCGVNKRVRDEINRRIGDDWSQYTDNSKRRLFKEIVLEDITLLREVINDYKNSDFLRYDFEKDIIGDASWHQPALDFTNKFPIVLKPSIQSNEDVIKIVREICLQFKTLIEFNGLNEVLYSDQKKPRRERIVQKLFFAVSYSYCQNNNLDISPEVNSGRGPIDFKFSYGHKFKVLVEVKLTRNPQLIHGYKTQLVEYELSERTNDAFYLVIDNGGSRARLDDLNSLHNEYIRKGIKVHELIIIDANLKNSASKY